MGEMNETEQIQWLDKTLVSVADIIKLNAITAAQKRYILEATRAYSDPSIRLDDSAESKDLVKLTPITFSSPMLRRKQA